MNDTITQRVVALFAVIAAVLVVVALVAVRNINREIAANDWVNQTHALLLEFGAVGAEFQSADAALRTYSESGSAQDEATCIRAAASIANHVEIAQALTRSDPLQAAEVDRLAELSATHQKLTRDILAARKAEDRETLRALIMNDLAAAQAEGRRVIDRLGTDQMALLARRDNAAYVQAETTRWTVWTGVGLNFVLLGFTGWLLLNDLAARRRAARHLQDANVQLDARVSERTAELAAANERLTMENLERRWGTLALEHQLRYHESIVDALNDLVFVLTRAQNISRINPAVRHLTGWESIDLINRPLSVVARLAVPPGATSTGIGDPITQALRDKRDLRDAPAAIIDRMNREWPGRLNLFPLRDGDKVVGAIAVFRPHSPSSELPEPQTLPRPS